MRVVVRYINLAIVETLRTVSARTEKRFRTYDDLVDCGQLKLVIRGSEKSQVTVGNVWAFVQLIFCLRWSTNQLYKNQT